ncbi:MAG TPA: NifB/NifX family molybdenum-iron cluster-binding protein [Caldisericia bacterium]|nr:MAG: hypothetical protein BWX90_00865 [bacterium ADurb.Bin132]HNW31229.1 NifB/NifX family molybdenum-iron cluster-binding protein [Caldisericia bacterium]HNY61136.1 NifB/NifX family molybdenum-iron cluster-binding protein [Caldisericia bacterium]HOC79108.1 NifB/NifX family molybdenum-iron cluster-binding protein [Caldisericia bacterium]HOG70146.1 NifB/NifX family molybdenum-iron cluster-binding protein [Caldisericia bacterium]
MSRPKNCRFVDQSFIRTRFLPDSTPNGDIVLTADEVEALKLSGEDLLQIKACRMMGVSRTTYARILTNACKKVADALINQKAITLTEGHHNIRKIQETEKMTKIIAVPVEQDTANPTVSGHFGKSPFFAVLDLENGKKEFHSFDHGGCGDIAFSLEKLGVKAVLVKGIGQKPKSVLDQLGISVLLAQGEDLEQVVESFKKGSSVNFEGSCNHDHGN